MRDLPENIDSKYRFITIAAKRCDMLQKGAKPKFEDEKVKKFTKLAMEEVLRGLINFEILNGRERGSEDKEGGGYIADFGQGDVSSDPLL